jgi:hypothetical protein
MLSFAGATFAPHSCDVVWNQLLASSGYQFGAKPQKNVNKSQHWLEVRMERQQSVT